MNKIIMIILLFLVSTNVFAKQEDWYTYWGVGKASHTYPGEANAMFNEIEKLPGVDRTEITLDMFGFYWPVSSKSIIGFVINGSSDRFDIFDEYVQLNQYLYGVSSINFTGKEIGDGFFYRIDGGIAKAVATDSFGSTVSSESGFGALGALGYGVPITSGTRLLFSATYALRSIEAERTSVLSFEVGALF